MNQFDTAGDFVQNKTKIGMPHAECADTNYAYTIMYGEYNNAKRIELTIIVEEGAELKKVPYQLASVDIFPLSSFLDFYVYIV